jgi:hypothetical protein
MEKTLVILDASALKESACGLRLFNNVILGYRAKINYNDMEFGTAFHLFRKIIREKGTSGLAEAMRAASTYYTTKPMLIKHNKKYLDNIYLSKTCLTYATTYAKDNFNPVNDDEGNPLLELTFSFPYYIDDEVEILMAGTMDEIGKFVNGTYAICDAKTTSCWDVENYFRSYYLSPQLLFYRWVLNKYAQFYPDGVFAKINHYDVACFIDGIFYNGSKTDPVFQRSEVFMFSQQQMNDFERLIEAKVSQLIQDIKLWRIDPTYRPLREGMINGACETVYGHCKYHFACAAKDDAWRDAVLNNNFVTRAYNPLQHSDPI